MYILQIANGYFGNKIYYHLFNTLAAKRIRNIIFAPQVENGLADEDEERMGNNVFAPECFSNADRFFFKKKESKIYDAFMNRYKGDISKISMVHAHTLFSNGYIAYRLFQEMKIPYIVAVRNTDINLFFRYRPHLRQLGIDIMKNADKIIFLSNASRKEVFCKYIKDCDAENLWGKTAVIPNGVDEFWIKNRKTEIKEHNNSEICLIYAGQINKNKNVSTTIKACKQILREGKKVKLIVVGKCNGSKFVDMLKEDFIEYHQHCSKEELIEYYRKSDIFVMPSIKESFGVVYAEALTQGLPVIYTKGQGFDEQFENGEVGYSVDCRDANEIETAIRNIYDNYEAIQENILKVNTTFNWDSISDKYIALYDKYESKC